MEHLYVDESGSMTHEHSGEFPYFVICSVRVKDTQKVKRMYKRFVSKYFNKLKELNKDDKMFDGDKFKELKGSSFDYDMKCNFVEYFCKSDLIEIYYIKVLNRDVKDKLYKNTARAFNFFYKLKLGFFLKYNLLPNDQYIINFDNRNQKNESKNSLEDYLNTELHLSEELTEEIHVGYFDSENNKLIQLADVFSNVFYSYCFNPKKYKKIIKDMKDSGCMKTVFEFPFKKG